MRGLRPQTRGPVEGGTGERPERVRLKEEGGGAHKKFPGSHQRNGGRSSILKRFPV